MGRTAFVMSGGGAKGAFELGALDYLIKDHGRDPQIVVGVSTGTLNAAVLAQGRGPEGLDEQMERLKSIWFGLRTESDIYRVRLAGALGFLFKADSIYANDPLWRLIRRHVDPVRLRESGRTLRFGVVDLVSGRYSVIDGRHERVLEMIRASASIPVFFSPVDDKDAGGKDQGNKSVGFRARYVDGGVRDITPLNAAFDALGEGSAPQDAGTQDPDTIFVILASPLQEEPLADRRKLDSGLDILKRSLGLLMNEVYRNDLKMAAQINASLLYHREFRRNGLAAPTGFPHAKYRFANLVLIQPDKHHLGTLEFDPGKIREAFAAGRERARLAVADAQGRDGSNLDWAEI